MSSPHDKLFKATFSQLEHARSELVSVLPVALTEHIEWSTLNLVSGELVDPQLSHLQSDLLYTVTVGDAEAFLYVLFEHQSTVDRFMPLRLLRYMVRIWERFAQDNSGALLPAIIPVVLHHSESGWTAALVSAISSYIEVLSEDHSEELQAFFHQLGPRGKEAYVATIGDRWKAEGRAEGLAQGQAEGRAEGETKGRLEGQARICFGCSL